MTIQSSVGYLGVNQKDSVTIVQHLMRQKGFTNLAIDGIVGPRTIEAIKSYQSRFMLHPDGLISPNGTTLRHLLSPPNAFKPEDNSHHDKPIDMSGGLVVRQGQFTFDVEGNDIPSSPYFSRLLHCPSITSGATIGRGYDMSKRSKGSIYADLTKAGIDNQTASTMSNGAMLVGSRANQFVEKFRKICGPITRTQQVNLFNNVYPDYLNDTKRIYNRYKKNDGCAWENLNSQIREIMIDMRFQGVFKYIQVVVFEENDIDLLIEMLRAPRFAKYENGRNRIRFLQRGK